MSGNMKMTCASAKHTRLRPRERLNKPQPALLEAQYSAHCLLPLPEVDIAETVLHWSEAW